MNNSVDLTEWGTNATAYPKDEALRVLAFLKQQHIAVLGGDVLRVENGVPTYTYENWTCDRNDNETEKEYVERSYNAACDYITRYPSKKHEPILFTIMPRLSNAKLS